MVYFDFWLSLTDEYQSFLLNADSLLGSVLASTLILRNMNDILSSTSNSILSYAADSALHIKFQLVKPLSWIVQQSQDNLYVFIERPWKNLGLSKKSYTVYCVAMNNLVLENRETLNLVGVTIEHNLNYHKHMSD